MQRVSHASTDDASAEDIEHDGEVEKPRRRRDVGDIGEPELIRSRRAELPLDEFGGWCCVQGLRTRTRGASEVRVVLQALGTQQPGEARRGPQRSASRRSPRRRGAP